MSISIDAEIDGSLSLSAMRASAPFAVALLGLLAAASPVLAHHVSGTAYCDQDWGGSIDAGDTPIAGVKVVATSLEALIFPGTPTPPAPAPSPPH